MITDLKLPGMTGEEVLTVIRATHSDQKVVILTGFLPDDSFEAQMRSLGAVALLEKTE